MTNNVTNAGTIQIGTGTVGHFAALLSVTSGTLTNTGTIVTAGIGNNLFANLVNQASGTINDAFPVFMGKVNGVYTNNGTWTVTGQTDISQAQSFTMAGGSIAGSAIFHVTGAAGGIFDHTGGTITATTNVENVSLKPRSSSGSATIRVVRSATTLGSDISVNDTVAIVGGFNSDDGVLTSTVSRVNNGTVRMTSISGSKTAKLIFTGATLTNNGTIDVPVASATNPINTGPTRFIQGNLINNGTININYGTKFPTPAATLVQNSGTTTVAGGITLDLTGSAGTFDLAGGIFKGTGTLTGQLQNDGGTVAPGDSPGVLTVTNFTQGPGGTLAMEIGGVTVGSENDRLVVTGTANLGGTLALTPIFGFVPDLSFDYDVLTSGSQVGTFATVTGTNRRRWQDVRRQLSPDGRESHGDSTVRHGPTRWPDRPWVGQPCGQQRLQQRRHWAVKVEDGRCRHEGDLHDPDRERRHGRQGQVQGACLRRTDRWLHDRLQEGHHEHHTGRDQQHIHNGQHRRRRPHHHQVHRDDHFGRRARRTR